MVGHGLKNVNIIGGRKECLLCKELENESVLGYFKRCPNQDTSRIMSEHCLYKCASSLKLGN